MKFQWDLFSCLFVADPGLARKERDAIRRANDLDHRNQLLRTFM